MYISVQNPGLYFVVLAQANVENDVEYNEATFVFISQI